MFRWLSPALSTSDGCPLPGELLSHVVSLCAIAAAVDRSNAESARFKVVVFMAYPLAVIYGKQIRFVPTYLPRSRRTGSQPRPTAQELSLLPHRQVLVHQGGLAALCLRARHQKHCQQNPSHPDILHCHEAFMQKN